MGKPVAKIDWPELRRQLMAMCDQGETEDLAFLTATHAARCCREDGGVMLVQIVVAKDTKVVARVAQELAAAPFTTMLKAVLSEP